MGNNWNMFLVGIKPGVDGAKMETGSWEVGLLEPGLIESGLIESGLEDAGHGDGDLRETPERELKNPVSEAWVTEVRRGHPSTCHLS